MLFRVNGSVKKLTSQWHDRRLSTPPSSYFFHPTTRLQFTISFHIIIIFMIVVFGIKTLHLNCNDKVIYITLFDKLQNNWPIFFYWHFKVINVQHSKYTSVYLCKYKYIYINRNRISWGNFLESFFEYDTTCGHYVIHLQ